MNSIESALEPELDTEIVPVILSRCYFYPSAHFRAAVFFAMAIGCLAVSTPWQNPLWLIGAQSGALLLGYLLCLKPFFKRLFSTSTERREALHQKALELFYRHQLNGEKPSVLILMGILERRIEILAGPKVDLDTEAVQTLIKEITRMVPNEGLESSMAFGVQKLSDLIKTSRDQAGDRAVLEKC